MKSNFILKILIVIFSSLILFSQNETQTEQDSLDLTNEILQKANVESARKEIELTVRSVDISKFPNITIMVEAYNKLGEPLDSLSASLVSVFENGYKREVIKVEKIPVATNVPVDFVFLVDKTGSMQQSINSVRDNIVSFTDNLVKRGIDYKVGLILFSDDVENIYDPTVNTHEFLAWISTVKARGGGDEKENALEALESAMNMRWRPEANKVCVLITDAPYHQQGEDGNGVTNQTTNSIIEVLQKSEIRVFSIVPKKLTDYKLISAKTRGTFFDYNLPFNTILDNFSNQLTNLFNVTYISEEHTIPDSIEIALFSVDKKQLVKKTIPIIELGRKLIIENLLFKSASSILPDQIRELDIVADFILNKPNIEIMVEGHTDAIGSHALNDQLSLDRAESVKKYLIKKGITDARIKTIGYGKRKPIASNDNEFGRRLNRRTEIVILTK